MSIFYQNFEGCSALYVSNVTLNFLENLGVYFSGPDALKNQKLNTFSLNLPKLEIKDAE